MPSEFPLPESDPPSLNLAAKPLFNLERMIQTHIEEDRYPGAQIAIARHGKLALLQTFGNARAGDRATNQTLWLLFSNTKILTMAAVWSLVEDGALSFLDPVASHLPAFAQGGKEDITIFQLATHQAGFPEATISRAAWLDHERMREEVCAFPLEWPPGSAVHYHSRSAHLVLAMVIEAVAKQDFRDVIRERVIEPLGLQNELFVGVPPGQQSRCADMRCDRTLCDNSADFRAAGLPHGGAYGTARAMTAFYQMMIGGGQLAGERIFSPRMISYVTRDFTGDRPDRFMADTPMHRGLGPHSRGLGERVRGLGSIASPGAYGHGGVGSSYCWADPASGVSFAYITNAVAPEPWHTLRLDRISNLVHAAID